MPSADSCCRGRPSSAGSRRSSTPRLPRRAAIEINGDPSRLDLEPRWIRAARARGLRFVVSTDAHSVDALANQRYGVAMARRGWVRRGEVLNTLDTEAFVRAVSPVGRA